MNSPFGRSLAVGLLLVAAISVVSIVATSGASGSPAPQVPLATSLSTGTATFVAVPMGHLNDPVNTFWQLFELKSPQARWSLDTPPGIADNGGLVLDAQPGGAIDVGLRPSRYLRFTATIVQSRSGAWAEAAVIPGALVSAADSLSGSTAAPYAAVNGGELLRLVGGSWKVAVDARELSSAAAGRCQVTAVDAVAALPGGQLAIGASCQGGDESGIFAESAGHWRSVGPLLARLAPGRVRVVVRLVAQGGRLTALVASQGEHNASLVALQQTNTGWAVSGSLSVPSIGALVSAGPASGSGQFVLWQGSGLRAAVSTASGWRILPPPPSGTKTLAFSAANRVDAVSVAGSEMSDYLLDPVGARWNVHQRQSVPILYGSSG